MKNSAFVIFSSINWREHIQLHHQFVNSIVGSGGQVLFVENTGVESPQIKDFGRIVDRVKSRLSSIHGFKDVQWSVGLDKIKIILYEYTAILHNWIAGRI